MGRDDDYANTLDLFKTSVLDVVMRLLNENGTRTHDLALYRLRDNVFAEHSHDRYLRCDSWLLKLDVGLEPFSAGARQRERSAFEMSLCGADALRDKQNIERRLRGRSDGIIELPAGATSVVGVSGR